MLNVKQLSIEGVCLISPARFVDDRGHFSETFNARNFNDAVGLDESFVQDNESLSTEVGTIRGLHFQVRPSAQGKLVRVLAGRVLDVVVDLRRGSETYAQHLSVELCAEVGNQLWVPPGLAHGFCTLEPDTTVAYKVTEFYDRPAERSLRWNDPALAIEWPVDQASAVLSDKDAEAPTLADLERVGHVAP